jgi:DNA-binding response OmpR family regulator
MSVVGNGKPVTEESRLDRDSSVARFKKTKSAVTAAPVIPAVNVLDEEVYDDGYLRIEHQNYYLTCDGEPVYLPRVEFLLISRLSRSVERVVTSEDLWRAAWGDDKPLNCGSLHVYIHRLRNSLRPYNLKIDALVNVGYRLVRT